MISNGKILPSGLCAVDKDFEELKSQAIALAEHYLENSTYKSEHHGDIIMPQGKVAKEFLERWGK